MDSACNYLSPQEHDDRNVRFPAQRDDSNNDDDDDESDEGSNDGQLFACQLEFESVFTELLRSYCPRPKFHATKFASAFTQVYFFCAHMVRIQEVTISFSLLY